MTTSTDRFNGLIGSSAVKPSVMVATTENITLAGLQTIDGVALIDNDRVLVKNQTNTINNGIWIASSGQWSRSEDFNGLYDAQEGTLIIVSRGTTNGGRAFILTTISPVVGVSSLIFSEKLIANGVRDFANIADLRNTEPNYAGEIVIISGHTTAGIGGGQFLYDSSDTTTSDDNGVTIVTTGGKRWKRIIETSVNSDMYGGNAKKAIESVDTKYQIQLSENFTPSSIINLRSSTSFDCNDFSFIEADNIGIINASGTLDGDDWVNLTSNMVVATNTLVTTLSLSVGDWVFVRSEALYDDPIEVGNPEGKYGQIFQITHKSGDTYRTDYLSEWSFLTTDTAQIRKINVIENVKIKQLNIGQENYTNSFNIGFDGKYLVNSEIETINIIGSKEKYASDILGKSAIRISDCVNVKIGNVITKHIGHYGIELKGANRNVTIDNIYAHDCRHAVSFNWISGGGYGKSINCHVFKGTADSCNQAGFDTHPNSTHKCTFKNIISTKSILDSGIQIRSQGITIDTAECNNNQLDGIVARGVGAPITARNIRCTNNLRNGIRADDSGLTIDNYIIMDNGDDGIRGSSIVAIGRGVVLNNQDGANELVVSADDTTRLSIFDTQSAPFSAGVQGYWLKIPTGYDAKRIVMSNNDCRNYNDFVLSVPTGQGLNYVPVSRGNNTTHLHDTGSETYGREVFNGGGAQTRTIDTDAFKFQPTPTTTRGVLISKIRLEFVSAATGITKEWRPLSDTQFEIRVSDDCEVIWEILGI